MDIGSSYQPSELISAFLLAQLEHAEKIIASRSKTFRLYYEGLKGLEEKGLVRLPHLQKGSTGNGHIFFIVTNSAEESGRLMQRLLEKQIIAIHHYVPNSTDVLAYTSVVAPREKETIFFHAPKQRGRYPFLCTFPGHWLVMNGEMIVE